MRAWDLEKRTTEQVIGQILQLIADLEERLRDLEHKSNQRDRTEFLPPTPHSPALS